MTADTSFLPDLATDLGLSWDGAPSVTRREFAVTDEGATLSALQWGDGPPEIVLLHGGAQNAHTWDGVMLALQRPALAIDLPGHGLSSHRDPLLLSPVAFAEDIARLMDAWVPEGAVVCGMSLGGLTAISLAETRPDLVDQMVVVDVTPAVDQERGGDIADFVADSGAEPRTFEELLDLTVAFNPGRSKESLRRGLTHNTRVRDDGTVVWIHQMGDPEAPTVVPDVTSHDLWGALERSSAVPLTFVRGSESTVVKDDDVDEVRRRRPDAAVIVVDGASHSVQGSRPLELAQILSDVLARGSETPT